MDHLCACPHCDALHRRPVLRRGEKALCGRCGSVLLRRHRLAPGQMLALAVTALVLFVIANAFPIVDLRVQGLRNSATLWGSVMALWGEGRQLVAVLVCATTQVFPLLDLLCMLALLGAAARRGPRPRWFAPLLRFLQELRPWGMVEVFMLGVVVSLVKLSGMARILPGTALWAFALLTIAMAFVLSFHPRQLWHEPHDD
jgi:paraquat-inducible protein A